MGTPTKNQQIISRAMRHLNKASWHVSEAEIELNKLVKESHGIEESMKSIRQIIADFDTLIELYLKIHNQL